MESKLQYTKDPFTVLQASLEDVPNPQRCNHQTSKMVLKHQGFFEGVDVPGPATQAAAPFGAAEHSNPKTHLRLQPKWNLQTEGGISHVKFFF